MKMLTNIKNIFFDLDRTLWDFEANTRLTLFDMYTTFNLSSLGIDDFTSFYQKYTNHNLHLWEKYKNNLISKEYLKVNRFKCVLAEYGIFNLQLAEKLSEFYINTSYTKTLLINGTIDILEYLFKKYKLYIITNGFIEVQFKKVKLSGISKYFKDIITSDEAGFKKPDHRLYLYALIKTGSIPTESVMIGDEYLSDIIPAKSCGMHQILFTQKLTEPCNADFCIKNLIEIKSIL